MGHAGICLDGGSDPPEPRQGTHVRNLRRVEWLAQISIWDTGETEVETVRKRDGQAINKHYDIANITDLDEVLVEVLRLLRDGKAPPDAFIP